MDRRKLAQSEQMRAKMNEFCAAMGLCNLRHIEEEIGKREKVVKRYREHLEGIDGIQLNHIDTDVKYNCAYFPVVFEEKVFGATRSEVFDALAEQCKFRRGRAICTEF